MNRKAVEMVFAVGVTVAALTGTANAQNSPGSGPIDAILLGAVEHKDVPGVVALVTAAPRTCVRWVRWARCRPPNGGLRYARAIRWRSCMATFPVVMQPTTMTAG